MRTAVEFRQRFERDVVVDVAAFLGERAAAAVEGGVGPDAILIDPGIGFGKNLDHNLDILARLDLYRDIGCALMLGVSRKSFIGKITGEKDPKGCVPGSLASALAGVRQGARLLRVHDVAETRQALNVWDLMNSNRAVCFPPGKLDTTKGQFWDLIKHHDISMSKMCQQPMK